MEMEKFYVAPEIEILEIEVEKGYVASGDGSVTAPGLEDEGAI